MKQKFFLSWILVLMSIVPVTCAQKDSLVHEQTSENVQQSSTTDYSSQIQTLVAEANNEQIHYRDGKTLFIPSTPNAFIAGLSVVALVFFAAGIAAGIGTFKLEAFKHGSYELPSIALLSTGIGIFPCFTVLDLLKRANKPCFILDKEGLSFEGVRWLEWKNVERISVQVFRRVEFITFLDKSNNALFEIPGFSEVLSDESLRYLVKLASYYRNQALLLPLETPCSPFYITQNHKLI